ncbi:tRNA sulfurtransferase ThiI [methanogenic archaeon mixed culture ISO4-G1]|nr:tRNA sulfurtransferase ThiI [methanogenic archaeon mixed culture ISO4-G1]
MAILLIRYAEIGLKSAPVRRRFESTLKDNMLNMLMNDGVEALVTNKGARFYVEATDIDAAARSLRKVFGIASMSVAEECTSKMDDMCQTAAGYSKGRLSEGESFAVKARREGSQGYTSLDMGREIGSAIFLANEDKGLKVDLTDPDKVFYVEARDNRAFIFQDYIRCHAGLPVGTQGKVIAYIDGTDRALVSAWLMMKRGCRVLARGEGDLSELRNYDGYVREFDSSRDDQKKALGIVMGTDLDGMKDVDVSQFELPVFFPTIGMSDDEVRELADTIRGGL